MTIENAITYLKGGGDLSTQAIMALARYREPTAIARIPAARKKLLASLAELINGNRLGYDSKKEYEDAARVVVGVTQAFGDEEAPIWLRLVFKKRHETIMTATRRSSTTFRIESFNAVYGSVLGLFQVASVVRQGAASLQIAIDSVLPEILVDVAKYPLLAEFRGPNSGLRITGENATAYEKDLREAIKECVTQGYFNAIDERHPRGQTLSRRLAVFGIFTSLADIQPVENDPLFNIIASQLSTSLIGTLPVHHKVVALGSWASDQLAK